MLLTARLLARLAHRFADREAILERNDLSDARFLELERRTIRSMLMATPARLCAFAVAFVDARAELLRIERPVGDLSGAETTVRAEIVPEVATKRVVVQPSMDELMGTLASNGGESNRPRSNRDPE